MIHVHLYSDFRFNSEARAVQLLKFLSDSPLAPVKYGTSEAASTPLSLSDLETPTRLISGSHIDFLSGNIFLKGQKYKLLYWIRWSAEAYSNWYIQLDDKYFNNVDRTEQFINFISDLAEKFRILFGGVAAEEDWDKKHWYVSETKSSTRRDKYGTELGECLPGIYWMTIFGETIVEQIGKQKFENLDVYYKLELATGGIEIFQSESPQTDNQATRLEKDKQVTEALGTNYFFDLDDRKRECDSLDLPIKKLPKSGRYDELENIVVSEPEGEPYDNIADVAEAFIGAFHDDIDEIFKFTHEALEAIDKYFAENPPHIEYKYNYLMNILIPNVGAFLGQVIVENDLGTWQVNDPLITSTINCEAKKGKSIHPFRIAYEAIFTNKVSLLEAYRDCEG